MVSLYQWSPFIDSGREQVSWEVIVRENQDPHSAPPYCRSAPTLVRLTPRRSVTAPCVVCQRFSRGQHHTYIGYSFFFFAPVIAVDVSSGDQARASVLIYCRQPSISVDFYDGHSWWNTAATAWVVVYMKMAIPVCTSCQPVDNSVSSRWWPR